MSTPKTSEYQDPAFQKVAGRTENNNGPPAGSTPSTPVPDIQQILAELAQYSSQAQSRPAEQAQFYQTDQISEDLRQSEQLQLLQLRRGQIPTNYLTPQAQSTNVPRGSDPRLNPLQTRNLTPQSQPLPKSPIVDPATILEWKEGLRCVNKISAQNPNFSAAIRWLMSDQEKHIQGWEKSRAELLKTQDDRVKSVEQLNEGLKTIDGNLASIPTDEENQAELGTFDLKIYKAAQQMHDHHAAELKKLGVPFFGVNPSLIIANELQQTVAARNPLSKAVIRQEELMALQRRMIQYLEEWLRD